MTKDLNATIQQHQPLRTPASWGKQERAFIVQLDEILDDIYRRFGRLKLSDMGKQMQDGITFIDEETGERKMISEAVSAVNLKVQDNSNSIAEINITTNRIETKITELGYGNTFMQPDEPENYSKGDIWIQTLAVGTWDGVKTDYASWQEIKNTVTTWQVVGGIPKVFCWDGNGWVQLYDAVVQMSLQTEIEQLADQIALRATSAELEVLSGQVTEYAAQLVVMAQQIQQTVTAVNAKPSTYVMFSDPTLTNTVHLGDQWIKHDGYVGSWDAIKGHYSSWQEFKDVHDFWSDCLGDRTYIWDGVSWVETSDRATEVINQTRIKETATQISLLATQQASLQGQIVEARAEISVTATEIKQYVANNFYGLVSGVSIVAAGVEISGSKYIKVKSGGKFLVDSGNFSIDASGNVVMTGTIYATAGTFSGQLIAATGTFAGSLSAATGTFAGNLSAAGGTFAGSLSAATGTFAGTMSAACVTSGTMSAARIKGGTLSLGGSGNGDGQLVIKNASGTQIGKWDNSGINAVAGLIGGWTLAANLLSSGSGSGYVALNSKTSDTYAIWAGNATAASAPFRVSRGGALTATNATITGTIYATAGTFAGQLNAATGTFAGNLSAAGGTFAGQLSAAGGTFAGNLSAAGGTFKGELVAATGSFKGSLSAATGTFAGNLSAAGGTFAGQLQAATGTFAGSLSAATGTFAGTLSAACITSGTMSANRISGGTLTLGGSNNTSGSLLIKNTSGTQIGKWDKDGISAISGTIGGWTLAANLLSSGSSTGYVALNSKTSDTYAMWVGAETAANAPWRVSRDGTHTITKLVITGENGSDTTINPKTYSMWKLYYNVIKSYTTSGGYVTSMTLSDGQTVNFNSASAVTLSGSWSSGRYSVVAYDGAGRVVATNQSGVVGFDNSEAGYASALTSNGWVSVDILAGGSSIGSTVTISGTGLYNKGWNDCLAECGIPNGGTVYTGSIRQVYDPNLDVWFNAVSPYYAHQAYKK